MVAVRMDPLIAPRVDPSDVVQDALAEASQRLPDYLQRRPIPFYPWLRQIAWDHLVHTHQKHAAAQKRTIRREEPLEPFLPEQSAASLVDRLLCSSGMSPSRHAVQDELRQRMRIALSSLGQHDREVLVLWYLEELSTEEIAAVLGLTEPGVKSRHRRALERLAPLLRDSQQES